MGALIGGALAGGGPSLEYQVDPNSFKIPDADKYRGQAQEQYDASLGRQQYIQPKQRSFLESLEQQAAGQGPSLAGEQLKSAQSRNLAQQVAAAQAARSANPALLQRQLMQQAQVGAGQTAEAAAQARIQEQLQARQMLQSQVNQMQGAADSGVSGYLQQGMSMAQAQQQALAQMEQMKAENAYQRYGADRASHQQRRSDITGAVNAVGQAAVMGATGGMGGGASPMAMAGSPSPSMAGTMFAASGGRVPGEPISKKDSTFNDVIHAKLSPGEVVIPVSKAQSAKSAKSFIDALFEKESKRK